MKSQKPVVIPADVQKPRPSVVPHGGIGGLLFWISICVLLGIGTFYFYGQSTAWDREARALRGDSEVLRRENQKLHAVVDQLQSELSQTGSLLRIQQDLLGQSPVGTGAAEPKGEELRSRTLSAPEAADLRVLEERLDKTFAGRTSAKEAAIIPRQDGIVIALDYRIFFPGAGLKIGNPGLALLHEVAEILQPFLQSIEVRIMAFADPPTTPPGLRKSPMSNWELPLLRSSAVAKALVEGEHLPAGQVVASCRGAELYLANDPKGEHRLSVHPLEIGLFFNEASHGEQREVRRAGTASERKDGR
ncbi:MAG: hypothetical protein AB7T14_06735 [Candidatus Methylacidiphilaceae bacterium]